MRTERVILVFMKAPRPGRVKTRLAAKVGDSVAAEIYRAFVEDTLSTCRSTVHPVKVMVSESDGVEEARSWLGEGFSYGAQEGGGLGERMSNAFRRAFDEGFRQVLLMGSDTPDLPADILLQGFEALEHDPAVIGPARDGGYYLIGFRSEGFCSEVFEGVEWSTDSVFSHTSRLLAANRVRYKVLPPWDDVDTMEGLRRLCERLKGAVQAPRTLSLLRKLVLCESC